MSKTRSFDKVRKVLIGKKQKSSAMNGERKTCRKTAKSFMVDPLQKTS